MGAKAPRKDAPTASAAGKVLMSCLQVMKLWRLLSSLIKRRLPTRTTDIPGRYLGTYLVEKTLTLSFRTVLEFLKTHLHGGTKAGQENGTTVAESPLFVILLHTLATVTTHFLSLS